MDRLLNRIEQQPFDYQYLIGLLTGYKYPRNKISKLLKFGDIIALKNGLYILSEDYRKHLSHELVANLLYGPSYISLDYALAYYGLIPETAYNISSVTTGRKKIYLTSIGTFTYHQLKVEYYNTGYLLKKLNNIQFMIASPEKAICDKLYLSPRISDTEDLEKFLSDNIRFEKYYLTDFNKVLIAKLALISRSHNLQLLKKIVG